jgi:hypothetical protein
VRKLEQAGVTFKEHELGRWEWGKPPLAKPILVGALLRTAARLNTRMRASYSPSRVTATASITPMIGAMAMAPVIWKLSDPSDPMYSERPEPEATPTLVKKARRQSRAMW